MLFSLLYAVSLVLLLVGVGVAQPLTPILDTFTRADGDINVGETRWLTPVIATNTVPDVVSNQCTRVGGSAPSAYWSTNFGPTQEVYYEIEGTENTHSFRLYCYLQDTPGAASVDGYVIRVRSDAGAANDVWFLHRLTDAGETQLDTAVQEIVANDRILFRCDNGSFTGYHFTGGVWTVIVGPTTDATHSASGFIGLQISGSLQILDDFGGGSLRRPGGQPLILGHVRY